MAARRVLAALIAFAALGLPVQGAEASSSGAVRMFVMQYRTDPAHVQRYDSLYREVRAFTNTVRPRFASTRPNVLVFPSYVGLHAFATGLRADPSRALLAGTDPARDLYATSEPAGLPVGIGAAFASLAPVYAPASAYYRSIYPTVSPQRALLLAGTDTAVRAFHNAFARIASELSAEQRQTHGPACGCEVFVIAGGLLPTFEEVLFSDDPSAVALVDPDILLNGDPVLDHDPITNPIQPVEWAYRATSPDVRASAFMWGPLGEVARRSKVSLGPLERLLDVAPGDAGSVAPVHVPGTDVRLGIALDGDGFASAPSEQPCSADGGLLGVLEMPSYVRCLDERGSNVLLHLSATGRRWGAEGEAGWNPLAAMAADWGAVADGDLGFRFSLSSYLVGNLADVVFDGQSAIWERERQGPGLARVGAAEALGSEPEHLAGPKAEAVAMVPWVVADAPDTYTSRRADLMDVASRLSPGSQDPLRGAYVRTTLCADIDLSGAAVTC
jgi:hypothetical protein